MLTGFIKSAFVGIVGKDRKKLFTLKCVFYRWFTVEYALEQIGLPYEVERKADARTFPMSKRPDSGKVTLTPIMVAFEK